MKEDKDLSAALLCGGASASQSGTEPLPISEQILRGIRIMDCGHHYCRYCDAGTSNGWKHRDNCAYEQSCRDADTARKAVTAMLTNTAMLAKAVLALWDAHGIQDADDWLYVARNLADREIGSGSQSTPQHSATTRRSEAP